MAHVLAQIFWLSLPVVVTGILHMVVVKANLFPALGRPMDGGRTLGGARIFGDNKTWRGVVFMTLASGLVGLIQGLAGGSWAAQSGVQFMDVGGLGARLGLPAGAVAFGAGYALVNLVLGFGYVLGELPNSFIKRRLAITPGKTGGGVSGAVFLVVDQADSVVAALGLGALVFSYSWSLALWGMLVLTLFHLLINAALYLVKLRKNL